MEVNTFLKGRSLNKYKACLSPILPNSEEVIVPQLPKNDMV